jgi:hypothetical protein
VALATITDADILDDGGDIITTQSLRDRFNAVLPRYTDPNANWNQITGEKIVGSTYVTEDGREIVKDWPLNLVRDNQQAGELASYAMADSREVGPVTLTLGAEWRFYGPGDCLRIESDEENFTSDLVVMNASYDPASLKTTFTFKGETPGKHDFALGKVAVPPPTPIVGQTNEERDAVAAGTIDPRGALVVVQYIFTGAFPITPGDGEIVITAFSVLTDDGRTIVLPAETITGLDQLTSYRLLWDLIDEEYFAGPGLAESNRELRRFVDLGSFSTSDGVDFPPPPDPFPPGWGGNDPNVNLQ